MVIMVEFQSEGFVEASDGHHANAITPKVSIIIPVYNVEKYIRQALDSVAKQTLEDIEIICVNDCTPDNSMRIVKEFARNDERFVLIEQETNQGQGVARNRALDIAKGDYIMFLDPDDWYELDACKKAYNQISNNQNDMVFFGLYNWKERNGKLGKRVLNTNRLKKFKHLVDNKHINLSELKGDWLGAAWTVCQIYSREFLISNNIRYGNEKCGEDLPFYIKAIVCSKDVSILDKPLYNYRKKINTFVTNYTVHYEDILSSKEKARQILEESEHKDKFWESFLLYEIGSDKQALKNYTKVNKKIRKDFYSKVRDKFIKISLENSEDVLKKSVGYEDFKLIIKSNSFEEYTLKCFIKKVFRLWNF